MSKVLLIEDRLDRMNHFLKMRNLDLSQFDILDTTHEANFLNIKQQVNEKDLQLFNGLDVLMVHQSAWSLDELKIIENYCESSQKTLILFTGGNTASHVSLNPYPLLRIHVNDFYSKNLELYLKEFHSTNESNLAILQYGKKWKLSALMEARNNIAVYLQRYRSANNFEARYSNLEIPDILFEMEETFQINLVWYKQGVEQNASNALQDTLTKLTAAIRSEIYQL